MNEQMDKARLGAIGENNVVSMLMQHGWDAFNANCSIKNYKSIDEAIVTSGGIKTNEINSSTMESKLIEGLFFAGEVIDVDAYTGGFNLQIAFSTGYLAAINC